LSGEALGIMRRPSDEGWTVVDPATQSFGQSISVTPIQMTTAFAAAINGGNLITPRFVSAYIDADGIRHEIEPEVRGHPISDESSDTIREMLNKVIDPENGFHPGNPKLYDGGGKSGTANVPVVNGYNDRQIASFIGFAPLEDPKIVILVKIDDNADLKTGTEAAGPVFSGLVDEILTYLNVEPNSARYVEAR
jgi:cell division protein FtsI/penicillin-binding protein 2